LQHYRQLIKYFGFSITQFIKRKLVDELGVDLEVVLGLLLTEGFDFYFKLFKLPFPSIILTVLSILSIYSVLNSTTGSFAFYNLKSLIQIIHSTFKVIINVFYHFNAMLKLIKISFWRKSAQNWQFSLDFIHFINLGL